MARFGLVVAVAMVAATGLAALSVGRALDWADGPGPLTAPETLIIDHHQGTRAIAEQLAAAGAIDSADRFALAVWLTRGTGEIQAGEYAVPAQVSPLGLLALLRSGRTVVHRLVVPEGLSSAEITALVNHADALAGTVETVPPEGSLLPDTYFYHRDDRRTALIERMHQGMERLVAELWDKRAPGLTLTDPAQAVTLASIVEKETGVADERPKIAAVFYNRLARDMRLQSDPTVIYALTRGEHALDHVLGHEDLAVVSPYNTYQIKGLPPGPIANPGRAALIAVLHPATTDALYFVADGSGGHVFAASLDEHNRNVARRKKAVGR